MTKAAAMRMMQAAVAAALLTGCYSIRHRNDPPAADGDTAAAATRPKAKHKGKEPKQVLPAGLGGDTEHKAYTVPPG